MLLIKIKRGLILSIIPKQQSFNYSTKENNPVRESRNVSSNENSNQQSADTGISDSAELSGNSTRYLSGSLPRMQTSQYSPHLDSVSQAAGNILFGEAQDSVDDDAGDGASPAVANNSQNKFQPGEDGIIARGKEKIVDTINQPIMDHTGSKDLVVENEQLPVENLPSEWEGKTVVQLSDIHATDYNDREYFKEVVEEVNALEPDIVVLTGDYVSGRLEHLDAFTEEAKNIETKEENGVVAVLGNHDTGDLMEPYTEEEKSGKPSEEQKAIEAGLEGAGITVLENESVMFGEEGEHLNIVGVGDSSSGQNKPDVAFSDRDYEDEATITLVHNPKEFDEISEMNNSTVLAGHTHGVGHELPETLGEWKDKRSLEDFERDKEYEQGFFEKNDSTMYVNRGLGSHAPRVDSPPEISAFTLENKE
jgi:uncharacterized protein